MQNSIINVYIIYLLKVESFITLKYMRVESVNRAYDILAKYSTKTTYIILHIKQISYLGQKLITNIIIFLSIEARHRHSAHK